MTDIPKIVVQYTEDDTEIPRQVIELPQDTEAPEAIPYVISFARYNERMCEISQLTKNRPKGAIQILKKIGTKISCKADFNKYSIDRIPVGCEGEYKKLYRGLEGIQIYEIKIQGDARIFYFDIEPKSIFFVIAITQNHFETDKIRR